MEYRHVNGKAECVHVREARPYTDANQYAVYKQAREALTDEQVKP